MAKCLRSWASRAVDARRCCRSWLALLPNCSWTHARKSSTKEFRPQSCSTSFEANAPILPSPRSISQSSRYGRRSDSPRPQGVRGDIFQTFHLQNASTMSPAQCFGCLTWHPQKTQRSETTSYGASVGGERRRVTIAEAFVSFSPVQFWDNSTRGMDSATALQCVQNFQKFTRLHGATTTLSLYQASQSILDCFDKVTVLYDGQQIYFGTWDNALAYFESLGFRRPQRCTTGDFLTALTNPVEARRMIIPGWPSSVPETSSDFAQSWKHSDQRRKVCKNIERLCARWDMSTDQGLASFRAARNAERSSRLCVSSLLKQHLTRALTLGKIVGLNLRT